MASCNTFQAQLLDYLYDLLDNGDRQSIEQHLEECASCRTALAQAQGQKQLLATAAKAAFPDVRFEAPPPEAQRPEPAFLPLPRRPRARVWRGWAIAASIILFAGIGVPAAWWGTRYVTVRDLVQANQVAVLDLQSQEVALAKTRQDVIHAARQEVEDAQKAFEQLDREQQAEWKDFAEAAKARQLSVVVSGPATLEPGAPNVFQIQTRNPNGQVVPAKVSARVLNEKKEVVFEEKEAASTGNHRLTLPPDLPLKPTSKLSLEVAAHADQGPRSELREELPLAAPVYLTHLATDKPMYQPGETVHFRSLTLERFSLKPASGEFRTAFTIASPNGQEVFRLDGSSLLVAANAPASPVLGPNGKPVQGIGTGEFTIPLTAPGGEYTLTVRESQGRFPEQQRKFIVNRYEKPRLNKELDFTRKSYGPGAEVVAACKVARVDGGPPVARRPVLATVHVDGKNYRADGTEGNQPIALQTDDQGAVKVAFKLPRMMERGQATLSVQFTDGANVEAIVRPIPVVLKKLKVDFFPEGGELVAGVPNHVYFQARTLLGKPAELKGHIVDQDGKIVLAEVWTLHDDKEPGVNQGMGKFAFTPVAGRKYELKIDAPAGMEGKYELPTPEFDGVVLSAAPATTGTDPIRVLVTSVHKDRQLLVGSYCRGRLIDHQTVTAKKGMPELVELRPEQSFGGVYRVTVFEDRGDGKQAQLTPVAERLLYRKLAEQLIVTVKPDKKQYVPGDKVRLGFTALDEKEQPAPAVLLVAVVDKSVITMADEKTARTMPTHYYLTTEILRPEDLEYADFLLTAHAKAAEALDLLLGTQGWRRFAEQNPGNFRQKFGQDADRLLVTIGQASGKATNLAEHEAERLNEKYAAAFTGLQQRQEKANQSWLTVQQGVEFKAKLQELQEQQAEAHKATLAAANRLDEFHVQALEIRRWTLFGLGGVLLVAAIFYLITALVHGWQRTALQRYALGAFCGLLVAGLIVLAPWDQPQFDRLAAQLNQSLANAPLPEDQLTLAEGIVAPPVAPPGGAAFAMGGAASPLPAPVAPEFDMPKDADANRALMLQENLPHLAKNGADPADKAKLWAAPRPPQAAMAPAKPGMPVGQAAMPRNAPQNFHFGDDQLGKAGLGVPAAKDVLRKDAAQMEAVQLQRRAGAEPEDRKKMRAEARMPMAAGLEAQGRGGAGAGKGEGFGGMAGLGGGGFGGINGGLGGGGGMPGMRNAMGRAMPGGMPGRPGGMGADGKEGWQAEKQLMPGGARGLQDFRRLLRADEAEQLAQKLVQPPPPPFVVREYAHQHQTATAERSDLVDTVYWHPLLVLPGGKGDVSFDLGDSVTTYEVTVFGHTLDGRLGAVKSTFESKLPFTLEPKVPIEVTAGDTIEIPVSVSNNSADRRPVQVRLTSSGLQPLGKTEDQLTLEADGQARRLYRFQPTLAEGTAQIQFDGQGEPFSDRITRRFAVVPQGFPVVASHSDLLEGVAQSEVVLPETWIKGTLKCQVQVYPSTLADLQKGLESLLREPCGCFEQTSTSNYPNLLILDYMKESDQAKPELVRRTRELLANGYQKLTSFECQDPGLHKQQGYEWFGGTAPPHEALTAYGLLQFRDMARVYDVDTTMVDRTRHYLMSRKDGQGGFQRNARALDTFGRAPDNITNAYIVWALTESSKDDDVTRELAALAVQAKDSTDPYFLSLVATSLINRNQADAGTGLLKKVAAAQKEDGHLDAATTSITSSGGRDLQIETTALAVLGWLKANQPVDFNVPLQKAVRWLGQQRGGYGGFGSTQSTILTLKALIAYTKANKKTAEDGDLRLFAGNQEVAHLHFQAGAQEALVLPVPEAEKHLKSGKNPVRIEMTGKNVFPYTLAWTYQVEKPVSAAHYPVKLDTRLDRAVANEGETVHLNVTVENTEDKGQGMAVAIVGLPAGLTIPEDMKQLKDHARLRNDGTEKGLISFFEVRGRELILYWRDLAPKQKIEVPLDLICRVPGEYNGPASRAYLYYNADLKHWVEPLKASIKAKAE
jgi:hypothetical protein